MNPSISKKDRIISLDIIRGIALFGILLINVGAYKIIIEGQPLPDYSGEEILFHFFFPIWSRSIYFRFKSRKTR